MKCFIAAACSLGLLFAWAASLALGALTVGAGSEPAIFNFAVGTPVFLVVCGVVEDTIRRISIRNDMAAIKG